MPDPVITPVNSVPTNITPVGSETPSRTPGQQAVYDALVAQPTSPGSTGAQNFAEAVRDSGLSSAEVDALIDSYHGDVADVGGFEAYYHGGGGNLAELAAAHRAFRDNPAQVRSQVSGFLSARSGVLDLVSQANLPQDPGALSVHLREQVQPKLTAAIEEHGDFAFLTAESGVFHAGDDLRDIQRQVRAQQQWADTQPRQTAAATETVEAPVEVSPETSTAGPEEPESGIFDEEGSNVTGEAAGAGAGGVESQAGGFSFDRDDDPPGGDAPGVARSVTVQESTTVTTAGEPVDEDPEDRLGGRGFGDQTGPLEDPQARRKRLEANRDADALEEADNSAPYTFNPDETGTKAADDAAAVYDPVPVPVPTTRPVVGASRPLDLVAADAEAVQRSGHGHPEFQDTAPTQLITAEYLKAGGAVYINGELVDTAAEVRRNTVYPDSVGDRGRGSAQRQETYERTLQELAEKYQAGQAQGSVSTSPRPAPSGPDLTWENLPTHGTLDGQRTSVEDIFNANVERTGIRDKRSVSEAERSRVLAELNDLYQKGRFVPEGSGGRPAPYFNPDTREGVSAGDLPDLVIPGAGFATSIHDARGGQSPGGTLVFPSESKGIAIEAAFAAAEVATIPVSGVLSSGAKTVVNTLKSPGADVALAKFRRQTADLIASGVDPTTARQVAATNQGQTVADMTRLEKGLTSPADPYAGLSTGQKTQADTERAVANALEVERKLTGNRDTPETIARRLQNQQHGTNQKTADELVREIDQKAYSNKIAFLRGREIPYPEVNRALYLKGVNERAVAASQTTPAAATNPALTTSYVEQLRALDRATRSYDEGWRLPDPPSDGISPTGWNPDSSGPEYGSRGNFWSARGAQGDGGVATLERTAQQTTLSADEQAALIRNTAGKSEFTDLPDSGRPTLDDVVAAQSRADSNVQPAKAADVDAPASLLDEALPTARSSTLEEPLAAAAVDPKAAAIGLGAPAASQALPQPATETRPGIDVDPLTTLDVETRSATFTDPAAGTQTEVALQTTLATGTETAPVDATKTKAAPLPQIRFVPEKAAAEDAATQQPATVTQPVAAQQTIVEDKTVTDDKTAVVPRTITEERPAFAPDNVPAPGYDFGTVPDPGTAPDHAQDLGTGGGAQEDTVVEEPTRATAGDQQLPPGPSTTLAEEAAPPPITPRRRRPRGKGAQPDQPAAQHDLRPGSHPHEAIVHEVNRVDLQTGQVIETPLLETVQVTRRGEASTHGADVDAGSVRLVSENGQVRAVSDVGPGAATGLEDTVSRETVPAEEPAARPRSVAERVRAARQAARDRAASGLDSLATQVEGVQAGRTQARAAKEAQQLASQEAAAEQVRRKAEYDALPLSEKLRRRAEGIRGDQEPASEGESEASKAGDSARPGGPAKPQSLAEKVGAALANLQTAKKEDPPDETSAKGRRPSPPGKGGGSSTANKSLLDQLKGLGSAGAAKGSSPPKRGKGSGKKRGRPPKYSNDKRVVVVLQYQDAPPAADAKTVRRNPAVERAFDRRGR